MGEEEWAAGMQGDVHKSRVSRLLCLKPFFETIVKGWYFNSVKQAKMKKKKTRKETNGHANDRTETCCNVCHRDRVETLGHSRLESRRDAFLRAPKRDIRPSTADPAAASSSALECVYVYIER